MASTQASEKITANIAVTHYLSGDCNPAKDIAWVDMRDYERILITVCAAALTGNGVTVFKILANDKSDGSGTDVEIKKHAVGSAPDAAGDYLMLECQAEEIAQLGAAAGVAARYVSANVTCANDADNIVVTYIRMNPKNAHDSLSADYVS